MRKALIPVVTAYQKVYIVRISRKTVDGDTLLPGDAGPLLELA